MSLLSRFIAISISACVIAGIFPINIVAEDNDVVEDNDVPVHNENTINTEEQANELNSVIIDEEIVNKEENVPEENIYKLQIATEAKQEETVWLSVSSNRLSEPYTNFSANYFANILLQCGDYTEDAIKNIITENGSNITISISQSQENILMLLSRTLQGNVTFNDASEVFCYSDWTIDFKNQTGEFPLDDDFQGLGDNEYPYCGTITGQTPVFVITKTLFKALDAKATLNSNSDSIRKIKWKGTANQAILADILFVDEENHDINMPLDSSVVFSPYIGTIQLKTNVNNPGVISLPDLNYSGASSTENNGKYLNNAGLLCGTMKEGTKIKFTSTITLPGNSLVLLSENGDVGSLVGKMENDAQFEFSSEIKIANDLDGINVGGLVGSMGQNAILSISSLITLTNNLVAANNAGGLVGSMALGSKIQLNSNIEIAESGTELEPIINQITATNSAGGLVGDLSTGTGSIVIDDNCVISLNDTESKVIGGTNAGGLYGICTVSGNFNPFLGINITNNTVTVGGNGSCGGIFGTLNLTGENNKCSIGNESIYVNLCSVGEDKQTRLGGITGTLLGNSEKNALVVSNDVAITDSTDPQIVTNTLYNNKKLKPQYLGGIVAYQQATLDVKNVCVKLAKASQTEGSNYFTGGLSAFVSDDMLLVAENIRSIFEGYESTDHNGGVVGYSGKGSVVYLKGNLFLKDCPLYSVVGCGQVVSTQDCSLIYAPDLIITRFGQGMEVDDIGNYGEIYRIPDFIEISENYSLSFSKTLTIDSNNIYVLNDELDYACLALAWQSRGEFNTVSNISTDNWNSLKNCSIKLGNNLALTGKGIGGLSRDVFSDDDIFKGTFDGNSKNLVLDIGAINSKNGACNSDGRIYFHNSTGLFAGISSQTTVINLTLSGSIRVSNNRLSVNSKDESANMKTGSLAGLLLCEGDTGTLDNVSTYINIMANSNTQTLNAPFYIGGLFGLVYGSGECRLNINGNLGATVSHQVSETASAPIAGQCFHTGGAIGAIDAGCSKIKIICNGAVISGKIERNGTYADNFYAGGLIGTIFPTNESSREVKLDNIKIGKDSDNPFVLSGGADLRMGGILGGIWADTNVTVSVLTVNNASINAMGTAKLGGLVYRASGKWEINNANLSGLKINANAAKGLGLLVCQGGTYKEPLNYSNKNTVNEVYKQIGSLYLLMNTDWENGYAVPENGNIAFNENGEAFDEFVAYTGYAYFTEANKDTPPYSITSNNSGVISLKTSDSVVNMVGADRNTYENRTNVSKKANLYSRYYYNLPDVKNNCGTDEGNLIDTSKELLMWSVYRYAAENIKEYFNFSGVETNQIGGGSASNHAVFDMNGLSYYPLRLTDTDITVQYADVTFYNQKIEEKVSEYKTTRGNTAEHTQHYTMHCGLFLDFIAEKSEYTETKNYTMTVNGVSFAGTVGKINGISGALLCGTVSGKYSVYAANCIVKLADEDVNTKAVVLNGIRVDSEEAYRPVLIGKIWEYSTLQSNYVTTSSSQTTVAGSSLIGDVGHNAATGLALSFSGTLKLPSNNDVFSDATLLNSLRYQGNTPATYQFKKEKDWKEGKHVNDVTYGYEISGSVEFAGEQSWYFDGDYISSTSASAEQPDDFLGHLPYIAHSPAKNPDDIYSVENGYHELEINVKPSDLLEGCGTYGDPYIIRNEKMLKSIAKYLEHPERTINGWAISYSSSNDYHIANTGTDIKLVFDSTSQMWSNGKTIEDIRKHLANAYYAIIEDLTLVSFSGLGTEEYPFSGVILGNGEQSKNISMTGTTQALILYSNGSVVRNLNISLKQNVSLRSSAPEMIDGNRTANRAPKNFFGGVIGCIMGGDNIIENVLVSSSSDKDPYNFSSNYQTFEHLVPIGGHVGVIAGGGVIFRGSFSARPISNDMDEESKYLYRNPFVGRVLNGFAFYECFEETANKTIPNNTNKNYKINEITKLSTGTHLTWDGKILTIKDSEGLLILSAIVSSGAGSFGSSLAYKTDFGISRNAKYNKVGNDSAVASSDFALASNISTPYLLSHEGINCNLLNNGEQSEIIVKLDNNLDVSDYENGYRGLSARYVSNSGFTAISTFEPYTIVMRLKSFDGNSKTVSDINMDVKEYDDDDFHAASIGGIFNIAWTNKDTGGTPNSVLAQNLTIKNSKVSFKYVDKDGNLARQAKTSYFSEKDGISAVATGGFIGCVNNLRKTTMDSVSSNYLFTNIRIEADSQKRSTIYGPNSAGGIIGSTGIGSNGYPARLITNGSDIMFGPSFLNCSYSNIDITGYLAAGGLVGCSATSKASLVSFGESQSGTRGVYATCSITNAGLVFAANSTVTTLAAGGICGGVFGGIGMRGLVNDSSVDAKTGLSILAAEQSITDLIFKKVDILADVYFDDYIYFGSAKNGVDSGGTIAAAGCIGRISNPNDVSINYVQFDSNDILNLNTIKATQTDKTISVSSQYAGGMVAYGYTTKLMNINNCKLYRTNISSKMTGGLIAYSNVSKLNVSNSVIQECLLDSTSYTGGITGDSRTPVNLYNISIKDTSITRNNMKDNDNTARLVKQNSLSTVYAAGISVMTTSKSFILPDNDVSGSFTGYVAYADYLADQTLKPSDSNSPYVTVNPHYTLPLADGNTKFLYGDAVKGNEKYISIAKQIWEDNTSPDSESKGNYTSYLAANKEEPNVSSLNSAIGEGLSDLPVLLVKGGDVKAITDYLDIITNGGYTAASKDTINKVTFTTTVYYLNEEQTAFTTQNWDLEHTGEPSVTTVENGKKLIVSGTSYDNTRHRFTLVEATFTTDLGDYTVSIPVVVQRKLEYVYMVTLSNGTEFNADTYETISNHLLESTDVHFSAYITFQYNQSYNNGKIEDADYDWKSYIEGGGNLINMDKTLRFVNSLPKGTQFTLVDCQHSNQAYYFCDNAEEVEFLSLSSFKKKSIKSTDKFAFSMADVLGITVEEDSTQDGAFTKLENSIGATLIINGEYFRRAEDGDPEDMRFNLIYPENLSTKKTVENYYLVIKVPKQSTEFERNGAIDIRFDDYGVPTNGTKIRRYNHKLIDDNNSTESTYNVSYGYQQLLETVSQNDSINLNDMNNKMHIEITDTITFSRKQAYSKNDSLYLKFSASIMQHINDETQEKGIPAGTKGTVLFYIMDTNGYYYKKTESGWERINPPEQEEIVSENYAVCSYDWTADGGALPLLLSQDGITPMDLADVRDMIYNNSDLEPKIIVKALMKEDIKPLYSAEDDPIPTSKNGTDNYAVLHYTAQLSSQERAVDYSTVREVKNDSTRYYRYQSCQAVLSMDATNIDQLGINPLQLVENYQAIIDGRNASNINMNAVLDLSNLQDIESLLSGTNSITYTLSLHRRNNSLYDDVENSLEYVKFKGFEFNQSNNSWEWTITKDSYEWNRMFDGNKFSFPIDAHVYTDQTGFANYQIKLDVCFFDDTGKNILTDDIKNNDDAFVIYTYACIKPTFYEPLN